MKPKYIFIVLISIIAVGCCLLLYPRNVFAASGDIGDGAWLLPKTSDTFAAVKVDAAAKSAPDWLQQLSEGVVIRQAEKICYPFRGGQFHWVPLIMQSINREWLPLLTVQEYLDGVEGVPYACAQTNSAGTFTLFGYYNGPIEPIVIEETEEVLPLECLPGFILVGDACVRVPNK